MNKRIDELWGQALDKAVPETYSSLSLEQVEKIKQVFAELLIKETTNVIIKGHKGHMNPAMAYDSVKQHFGVEE